MACIEFGELFPGKLRDDTVELESICDDWLGRIGEALTMRSRRRSVEHDQETPPCMNAGRHTSSDSPLLEALRSHVLNCEKALKACEFGSSDRGDDSEVLPKTVSSNVEFARKAELAKIIRNGPDP